MGLRYGLLVLAIASLTSLISCAHVSKRMPDRLAGMEEFLTQDNPRACEQYHYNFERQVKRLYIDRQNDSLFDAIEFIRQECGPSPDLDITSTLLRACAGQYDDSLIGPATVPQMLWYRGQMEWMAVWSRWNYPFISLGGIDNTHTKYLEFQKELADDLYRADDIAPEARLMGQFYAGGFDDSFARLQTREYRSTTLGRSYEQFVEQTKRMFPSRLNVAFVTGSWRPRGGNEFLGNHPDIGMHMGWENRWWRIDGVVHYRFSPSTQRYDVDSLGQSVSTNRFNSWLWGVDAGFKFFDNSVFSTDLFAGVGYDYIESIQLAGEPPDPVIHDALALSAGLRHRFFVNQRSGLYIGAQLRYSSVNYSNPGGTDLSGNSLTISLITGWSIHETLKQFLDNLNYRGSSRP